jgi:Cdc6-like AAA superfamily ATPase
LHPRPHESLVGRRTQAAALRGAFERARAGTATVTFVSGRSGMGKSALVQEFIAELERPREAVVLRARCYEREELPCKAFDPLIADRSAARVQFLVTSNRSTALVISRLAGQRTKRVAK